MVGYSPLSIWAAASSANTLCRSMRALSMINVCMPTTIFQQQTNVHNRNMMWHQRSTVPNNAVNLPQLSERIKYTSQFDPLAYSNSFQSDPSTAARRGRYFQKQTKNESPLHDAHSVQKLVEKSMGFLKLHLEQKWGGWFSVLVKALLPVLLVVNVALAAPILSTINSIAIFCAAVAPLLGDLIHAKGFEIKVACHHFVRDRMFPTLMDTLILLGVPALACNYPRAVPDFFRMGSQCTRIQYGESKSQILDMYMPHSSCSSNTMRGMVFFVHGGAWGSGNPLMYRLIAKPFLDKGMAVAIVGYRTFPEGDVFDQVNDLELAAAKLTRKYPELCLEETELGMCLVGHSSGAHISLIMMVERLRRQVESFRLGIKQNVNENMMRIDSFVGISGPYNIARHFQFEASRGLAELSPMTPACRGKQFFEKLSPAIQLFNLLSRASSDCIRVVVNQFPSVCLVHGVADDTVPITSTQEAATLIRMAGVTRCDELFVPHAGHCETILQFMFGGMAQDAIFDWIEAKSSSATTPKQNLVKV